MEAIWNAATFRFHARRALMSAGRAAARGDTAGEKQARGYASAFLRRASQAELDGDGTHALTVRRYLATSSRTRGVI